MPILYKIILKYLYKNCKYQKKISIKYYKGQICIDISNFLLGPSIEQPTIL